jgi:ectoine hydroxylase-related dioxygenase (phytanoyl-CoA dioxygenase family)
LTLSGGKVSRHVSHGVDGTGVHIGADASYRAFMASTTELSGPSEIACAGPSTRSALAAEVGVFHATDLDAACAFFMEHGFVVLRGVYDADEIDALEAGCVDLQRRLLAGELPEHCGTVILDGGGMVDGQPFAHYVCHANEVSDVVLGVATHPVLRAAMQRFLGADCWLLEHERFGVVYQDSRPGDGSAYSRIGWHSDHQSGPNLAMWPSVAFTVHIDGTSPENGFLRVVPGTHHGGADGMPLGFEKVSGEIAVYAERGDLLLHHADLWHSAAKATEVGERAIRRHVRGGWYGGERLPADYGYGLDDFNKNAKR